MKHADDEIWILVAKHLKGELSESEKRALDRWKESSTDNKAAVEQMETMWHRTTAPSQHYAPDVDRGWQRFRFSIDSEQGLYHLKGDSPKERKLPLYRKWWALAASVILVFGVGFFIWQMVQQENMILLATYEEEKVSHFLPDSSQVWLNENTRLSYAEDFNLENRIVYLEGEAFFEVKKAEGRRFTVYSGGAKTEVIGTSFNIRAYEGEPVKVQVVTGRVAFSPAGEDNSIFLTPGMEAVLEEDQTNMTREKISDPNFRAWQNQEFVFNNTSLAQVIQTLEEHYAVDIALANAELANCRYTATFRGAHLSEILNVLTVTGNLTLEQSGNRYILSGEGCR